MDEGSRKEMEFAQKIPHFSTSVKADATVSAIRDEYGDRPNARPRPIRSAEEVLGTLTLAFDNLKTAAKEVSMHGGHPPSQRHDGHVSAPWFDFANALLQQVSVVDHCLVQLGLSAVSSPESYVEKFEEFKKLTDAHMAEIGVYEEQSTAPQPSPSEVQAFIAERFADFDSPPTGEEVKEALEERFPQISIGRVEVVAKPEEDEEDDDPFGLFKDSEFK